MDALIDIVCVSHLGWDWVWQRPQQLLSRLAAEGHRVLYVEEPRIEIGPPWEGFEVTDAGAGVEVARLTLRSDHDTFWSRIDETRDAQGGQPFDISPDITRGTLMFQSRFQPWLEREVAAHVAEWRRGPLALWLYTPLVASFIDLVEPDAVVYDVMDDLSAFRFAPSRLREQEQYLLERADLVFAGGPSLHRSVVDRRPDAHLFPSGVDAAHFARALGDDLEVPGEVAPLARPVVGFIAVVDERTDLELLDAVAALRPDVTWVLVGPVLKIKQSALPRQANLHYIGQQPYERLPAFLRSFDVAMMPFAINDATRSISPTKTLEYLAAGKPVVSTPVPDVIELYGSMVRVAATPDEFVAAVDAALHEPDEAREQRAVTSREVLTRYSWDAIVAAMGDLLEERLRTARGAALAE